MTDEQKPKLTPGEFLMCLGKTLIKAGEEWDDDGRLTADEIPGIIQVAITEAIKEMSE